jgi:hypothetical protein
LTTRYGGTPTSYLFPDRSRNPNDVENFISDYAAFCFDEACALAGVYAKIRAEKAAYEAAKAEAEAESGEEKINIIPEAKRKSKRKPKTILGDPAPPQGVAEIRETPSGPIIVGSVPVIKRTKPYVRRMTVEEAAAAAKAAQESET